MLIDISSMVLTLVVTIVAAIVALHAWTLLDILGDILIAFFAQHKRPLGVRDAALQVIRDIGGTVLGFVVACWRAALSVLALCFSLLSWLLLGSVVAYCSYVLYTNQVGVITNIDRGYEIVYSIALSSSHTFVDLFVALSTIFVGLINFFSAQTKWLLIGTTTTLLDCPGYLTSTFQYPAQVALSSAGAATSFTTFITTPGFNASLDLTSTVMPLQHLVHDLLLRLQCACPAENGTLAILQDGLFDATSTTISALVSSAANTAIVLPQIVIASTISYAGGSHEFLNTDFAFRAGINLVNALENAGNQLLANAVSFVNFHAADAGLDFIPWPSLPLFSIPGRLAVAHLSVFQVLSRAIAHAPLFLSNAVSGLFYGGKASVDAGTLALDASAVYDAVQLVLSTTFLDNFGHVSPYAQPMGRFLYSATNVTVAYWYFVYKFAVRTFVGPTTTLPAATFNAEVHPACKQAERTWIPVGSFASLWTALYESVPVYDAYVTSSWQELGNSLNNLMGPYYSPVGQTGGLAIQMWAELNSRYIRKHVYIINSFLTLSPPNEVCFDQLNQPGRVVADALVRSLGGFTEFFLDIGQSQGLESAYFNCADRDVANYMYAGSMKLFYFASKMCNTRYTDGQLVQCSFANAAQCPGYVLAQSNMNTHLLCAIDKVIVEVVQEYVVSRRLRSMYSERAYVTLLACIIDPTNRDTCPLTPQFHIAEAVQLMALETCNAHNSLFRVTNVATAVLGFIYDFVYSSFSGTNIRGTGINKYNELLTSGPALQLYAMLHNPTEAGGLSTADMLCAVTSQASQCMQNSGSPNYCVWDGQVCSADSGARLAFQPFPLEAATQTLLMAVLSGNVWDGYLDYTMAEMFDKVLALDYSDPSTLPQMLGNLFALIKTDEFFYILQHYRVKALRLGDFLFSVLEFIRTFVVVFNKGIISPEYQDFHNIVLNVISLVEQIVKLLVTDGFKFVMDVASIMADIASTILEPQNAGNLLADAWSHFENIIKDLASEFANLILQFPGVHEVCQALQQFINFFNEIVINTIFAGLFDVINGIIGVVNDIADVVSFGSINGIPDLPLAQTMDIPQLGCSALDLTIPTYATMCTHSEDCQSATDGIFCTVQSAAMCASPAWNRGDTTVGDSTDYRNTNAADKLTQNSYSLAAELSANPNDEWDFPCPCNQVELITHNVSHSFGYDTSSPLHSRVQAASFCNYGSGLCEAGIQTMGDPLRTCPPAGSLDFVDDTPWFNALCWTTPAWECNPNNGSHLSEAAMQRCVKQKLDNHNVQGPSLCRESCGPDVLDFDNKLVTHPVYGCVCARGWSVGAGNGTANLLGTLQLGGSVRRLLGESARELSGDPGGVAPQTCTMAVNCDTPTARCASKEGDRSCGSCPLRNWYDKKSSGFGCINSTCTCLEVRQKQPRNLDFSAIQWVGSSRCALLGQAPRTNTTLEFVELRDCATLHYTALTVTHFMGLPVPPRVLYDWWAAGRATAHIALSLAATDWGTSDDNLRAKLHAMHIDTDLGVAVRADLLALAAYTNASFPAAVSAAQRFKRIVATTSTLAAKAPSVNQVITAVNFAGVNSFNTLGMLMERVPAVAPLGPARRRIMQVGSTSSCPVLNDFLSHMNATSGTLVQHLQVNGQRAACRLLNHSMYGENCPPPTWNLNMTGPRETLTQLGSSISGFTFGSLTHARCGYNSTIMCTGPRRHLPTVMVLTAAAMSLAPRVLGAINLGMLSPLVSVLAFFLYFPVVVVLTYGIELGCLFPVPAVPVCMLEDLQNVWNFMTPKHLPWPHPLVNSALRVPLEQGSLLPSSAVLDCVKLGFATPASVLVFGLDRVFPSWQRTFPSITSSVYLSPAVYNAIHTFDGNTTSLEYEQCAALFSITLVPAILAAGIAALAVFFLIEPFIVLVFCLCRTLNDMIAVLVVLHDSST